MRWIPHLLLVSCWLAVGPLAAQPAPDRNGQVPLPALALAYYGPPLRPGADSGRLLGAHRIGGEIVDVRGRPVVGATVSVTSRTRESLLGTAVSDAEGRWGLSCPGLDRPQEILLLVVTAPGFARWSDEDIAPELPSQVHLARPADEIALELAALPEDAAEVRLWDVIELLSGQRPAYYAPPPFGPLEGLDADELRDLLGIQRTRAQDTAFAITGRILPELRAIALSHALERQEDCLACEARWLLSRWIGPTSEGPVPIVGWVDVAPASSPEEFGARIDALRGGGEPGLLSVHCTVGVTDDTGTHVLLDCRVRYVDGLGDYELLAMEAGGTWSLVSVRLMRHVYGRW